jgi:hypothetical protein
MRVHAKIFRIFSDKKLRLTSDLQRGWVFERRSAACGYRRRESSERLRRERQNRADLLELGCQRSETGQSGPRGMGQRVNWASAIAGAAEAAFRLFHLRTHEVQVVGHRDHWEQQNECTAKGAEKDERGRCRSIRRSTLPPQQIAGQQKGEPAKIEKKLHTKMPRSLTGNRTHPNLVPSG